MNKLLLSVAFVVAPIALAAGAGCVVVQEKPANSTPTSTATTADPAATTTSTATPTASATTTSTPATAVPAKKTMKRTNNTPIEPIPTEDAGAPAEVDGGTDGT